MFKNRNKIYVLYFIKKKDYSAIICVGFTVTIYIQSIEIFSKYRIDHFKTGQKSQK
jgi:lipid-A-disaccharide synthase-like uncharacterized protein